MYHKGVSSLMPYPFMIYTIFLSFNSSVWFIISGAILYLAGMIIFIPTIKVMADTSQGEIFRRGPYKFSRNPMYLSAGIIFTGIAFLSEKPSVFFYLVVMFTFQHFMILAEERACREKFGKSFDEYLESIPRYLIF